jgi:Spy/CpxP family protein refolding chaperone
MKKLQLLPWASAVFALSLLAAVLAPFAGQAQTGGGSPGPSGDRPRMHRMLRAEGPWVSIALRHKDELKLSAEQVSTLEKIRTHYQDQTTPIREQLSGVEDEISGLLQETPANLIQAKLKIEQAEKLRAQLRYLRVEALENGKSVLSAHQRDQLKTIVSSRHPGFRKSPGQPS